MLLRTIHEIAASTITARQAAKNAFTGSLPFLVEQTVAHEPLAPVPDYSV
jgi:hypothetical protein